MPVTVRPAPPAAPAAPPPPGAGARPPRQARGQLRVDAILDAAAALIAESGVAAVSIQDIARRAGASPGSMYHFFPTKDGLVAALLARYRAEFSAVLAEQRAQPVAVWAAMPTHEFVRGFFRPIASFFAARPAYVRLADPATGDRRPGDAAEEAAMRRYFESLLRARTPGAPPSAVALRAATLFAMGDGVFRAMGETDGRTALRLFDELARAVACYLASYEAAGAG